jgi:hypothetical protein
VKNSFRVLDYWDQIAEKWQFVGQPLRPGDEDIRVMYQAVTEWIIAHPDVPPRCLILGVTPEFAGMAWPDGTSLTAVDGSPAMIKNVWPGYPGPGQGAVCMNWHNLHLPDASKDIVLGDGCFTVLTLHQGRELMRSMKSILCADGIMITRFFVRPEQREQPEAVLEDLMAGHIGSFDAFKWRLVMSLYDNEKKGVRLREVWDFWHKTGLDTGGLVERMGWLSESVATIDLYRGIDDFYYFPTMDELRSIIDEQFRVIACYVPTYELGERCPILILRPKVTV